ncbi:MAG: glycine--tRNA ligase subunit beta [Gammaproteobacteria bacterium]
MNTDTLLIELGTEELPPKALKSLSKAFADDVQKRLQDKKIGFAGCAVFASPRRLGLQFSEIETAQADQVVEKRGPAIAAAFDDSGEPTKAAIGFARSCGVEIEALGRLTTDKGEWLAYSAEEKGEALAELLPPLVSEALNTLPIPKRMRWGDGDAEFVRPVHWLLMMLGKSTIDADVLGISSGNSTYGHRFHSAGEITLQNANDYPEVLTTSGHVIADFETRRETIKSLTEVCAQENSATAIIDDALLDEVTALVEWPEPICGSFDKHFLALPREVLIASMQDHQKYFPMQDSNGELVNKFITIANIKSSSPEAIRAGNERVIRPRLSDAKFFWDQDLKSTLDEKKQRLANIVFEKQLGTLLEKTERVASLGKHFAGVFGAEPSAVTRTAELSRADLVSEMVGEFPELQGLMAGYYAQHANESPEVQRSLREFYYPRFAGDAIPQDNVAQCVSVCDRLDTLVGIFAIGSAPTGEKDPYALRRAALGTLRILIEGETPLDLRDALDQASELIGNKLGQKVTSEAVLKFMLERLRNYYLDKKYTHSVVDAVLALTPTSPFDFHRRIIAVVEFSKLSAAADLAAANKRISNILKKAATEKIPELDPARLVEPAELALAGAVADIAQSAIDLYAKSDYTQHLSVLAQLKSPINDFFDQVMVMADDEILRLNRLALLTKIREQFSQVADISLLSE